MERCRRTTPSNLAQPERSRVQSACELPLTTARRRLGILAFACKQPSAYDAADVGFLQLVANQVALAVENALTFQEIEALKDKLAEEKAYLEEEVRTEHEFGEIVGVSAALRRVLKQDEIVAATNSTVLIRGETGTGKELIARALHDLSPRRDRTFVKLNCAAIPTGLRVTTLLARGIKPLQCEIDATKRHELTDVSDLNFGIGTVFITDPEGNVIEFMQADRGVFAKYHF
jgi:transcriptional regulator with GAF, ATPase, and Fis domain